MSEEIFKMDCKIQKMRYSNKIQKIYKESDHANIWNRAFFEVNLYLVVTFLNSTLYSFVV